MNTSKLIEQVKDALMMEYDSRKCFDTSLELSNGLKIASVELCKGKIDALTAEGYKNLDEMADLTADDWDLILSNI